MEVATADLAQVPVENVLVSRAEFDAVAARGSTDWCAGGIVLTCRWLAGAVVTDQTGRPQLPYSPAS
ncbi:hypothetical protein I4I73_31380 [Pseudonocardia sp. KRD-184]|uniref:Uncharacterized protein n=1 Tax=Pseudonocardia oceani TaxID=2792013 RepID=A0ABS6U894_9PSEU|nr:hypothetical protein [Pseudonocardia oceani]MBW0093921.1 hypothetical protein [Pseudonocardia oceani]MBW0100486.1 hypothetical protein [Pseudonocardia oceani]MBW0112438.1 hypothetical protein [Pseudonocardia oceani]MBW0125972.1 hypothetical protein [Pseudonocardia oceani]MBW0128436.1 hypothetical protein [Pseudonocardia oceani]